MEKILVHFQLFRPALMPCMIVSISRSALRASSGETGEKSHLDLELA